MIEYSMSYYHLNGTHIFKRSQTKGISAAHFAERNTKFGGGKSEGGQKIPSPNPLPFCPPERQVSFLPREARQSVRSSVQKRFAQSQILVRGRGLEPPRPCGHMHLKHAWLPLQHPRVTPRRRFFGGFFSWKDFSKNTFLSGELFWANLKC